jgi:hypothetical protein
MPYEVISLNNFPREFFKEFHRQVGVLPSGSSPARDHSWHYGRNGNRLGVVVRGALAGYCALIPTRIMIRDRIEEAHWWVDLIVAPHFRGRGVQSLLDQEVRQRYPLLLGFPNRSAASIHRRHGWGVREDGRVYLLPLSPSRIRSVINGRGLSGAARKAGAVCLSPAAALWRLRLGRFQPRFARRCPVPDPGRLARSFRRFHPAACGVTTCRDESFFQRRYLEAPDRKELVFYEAGPLKTPSLILVARQKPRPEGPVTRILDLFGDLSDQAGMKDLLKFAVKDAIDQGSGQVTGLHWGETLVPLWHGLGFFIRVQARFCWHSVSTDVMQAFQRAPLYWTLGDSDQDEWS